MGSTYTFNSILFGGADPPLGQFSARELIHLVFRMLTILRPGQTGYDEAIDECFTCLNQVIDGWSAEALMVPSFSRTVYPLLADTASYTYGFGQSFDSFRPPRVEKAGFIQSGTTEEYPFDVLSLLQYQAGAEGCYVEMNFPDATVYVNPTPQGGESLVLYAWRVIEAFADLDTEYLLPPSYGIALRYALAVEYAPLAELTRKGQAMLPLIIEQARTHKGNVKRSNIKPAGLRCDPALVDVDRRWGWPR